MPGMPGMESDGWPACADDVDDAGVECWSLPTGLPPPAPQALSTNVTAAAAASMAARRRVENG